MQNISDTILLDWLIVVCSGGGISGSYIPYFISYICFKHIFGLNFQRSEHEKKFEN